MPGLLLNQGLDCFDNELCISLSAHLQKHPAARFETCENAIEYGAMICEPMQYRIGKNQIEAFFEAELRCIHQLKGQIGMSILWVSAPGQLHHGRGTVDSDYPASGQQAGDLGSDLAIAAADIEQRFISVELEFID
jgi:hypothetical protein